MRSLRGAKENPHFRHTPPTQKSRKWGLAPDWEKIRVRQSLTPPLLLFSTSPAMRLLRGRNFGGFSARAAKSRRLKLILMMKHLRKLFLGRWGRRAALCPLREAPFAGIQRTVKCPISSRRPGEASLPETVARGFSARFCLTLRRGPPKINGPNGNREFARAACRTVRAGADSSALAKHYYSALSPETPGWKPG